MQAYLRADEKVLQQHCSPENVERLTSIVKAEQAQVIADVPIRLFRVDLHCFPKEFHVHILAQELPV